MTQHPETPKTLEELALELKKLNRRFTDVVNGLQHDLTINGKSLFSMNDRIIKLEERIKKLEDEDKPLTD